MPANVTRDPTWIGRFVPPHVAFVTSLLPGRALRRDHPAHLHQGDEMAFFRGLAVAALLVPVLAPAARAQTAADTAAIRATAMDYIEGYYTGDADRMTRALHPELAKRIVRTDSASGRSQIQQMSAMTLINGTRAGGGKTIPVAERHEDFRILDIYRGAAVAKIVASSWIDYLELARWNGEWKIVNVLWELTSPGEHPKP